MKREELTALNIPEDAIEKIMAMNGRDIEKHKLVAEEAQTKVSDLTEQLSQRDSDIAELKKADAAGLQTKLSELETKYENDRKQWEQKEQQRAYADRRNAFFSDIEFTDDYAKRGIFAEFDERKFQYSDADKTFVGGKEWLEKLKADHPTSFKGENKPPVVVLPTGGKIPDTVTKESFAKMGYRDRLALKKQQPELYKQIKE